MLKLRKLSSQKGNISLLLLLLLILSIGTGVFFLKQPQIFSPKADEENRTIPETSFIITSDKPSYKVGDTIKAKIIVRSDSDPANLFAAKLSFNTNLLSISSIETSAQTASPSAQLPEASSSAQGKKSDNKDKKSQIASPEANLSPYPFPGNFFIKLWADNFYDNDKGLVSLIGGVTGKGYQTNLKDDGYIMAIINFQAKAAGVASVTVDNTSAIYSGLGNSNILSIKKGLAVLIKENTQDNNSE